MTCGPCPWQVCPGKLNLIDTIVKFQTVLLAEGVDPASLPEAEEIVSAPIQQAPVPLPPADEDEGGEEGEDAEE